MWAGRFSLHTNNVICQVYIVHIEIIVPVFFFRDVEQSINNLQPPHNPFSLGNTGYLSHEYAQDRQALYNQLVLSYKWTDKVVYAFFQLFIRQVSSSNACR